MRQHRRTIASSILSIAAITSACGGNSSTDTLKIGAIISATGDGALGSDQQLNGIQFAAEEINSRGGVLGKQLEVIVKDDASSDDRAMLEATNLADEGVPVVIGTAYSSSTKAAAPVLSARKVTMISGSATASGLTTLPDDGFLFRTCASDAYQGELVAHRAYAQGHRRMAIIPVNEEYGLGLAATFQAAFESLGGTISYNEPYTPGKVSYVPELTQLLNTSPDGIFLPAQLVDGAQIVRDYNTNFSGGAVAWYFSEALGYQEFVNAVGTNGFFFPHEGVFPAVPTGPRNTAFVDLYTARFGSAPIPANYVQHLYDAVYLAALAMEAGNRADGVTVRDNLVAVSSGGAEFDAPSYAQAVAALKEGQDINFQGTSGTVDLNAQGDITGGLYDIWNVQAGAITTVESNVSP